MRADHRWRNCPEVERTRLDRQHRDVRGDGRALRDIAKARRAVQERRFKPDDSLMEFLTSL